MISDVQKIFDAFITTTFAEKPDIQKFLLTHERRQTCVSELCQQILICERRNLAFNAQKYTAVIENVSHMFCRRALQHHAEQLLSRNERQRRITDADKLKVAQEMFKELGETVTEI